MPLDVENEGKTIAGDSTLIHNNSVQQPNLPDSRVTNFKTQNSTTLYSVTNSHLLELLILRFFTMDEHTKWEARSWSLMLATGHETPFSNLNFNNKFDFRIILCHKTRHYK